MMQTRKWSAVYKLINSTLIGFIAVVSISAGAGQPSQVETLLISDIDDTLKVVHVLSTLDVLKNAMRTDNTFLGMTSAYQLLARGQENMVFAYLSNAPEVAMGRAHAELLRKAQFPAGELFLRANINDNEHKNRVIRALVKKHQPKNLILIGDNAEQDTLIYSRAAAEFPELNIKVFIHQLYSSAAKKEMGKKLEPGQVGYVTAVELVLHWLSTGAIRDSDFRAWTEQVVTRINEEPANKSEGVVAFPKWMNCKDFSPNRSEEVADENIAQYVIKRDQRCLNRSWN